MIAKYKYGDIVSFKIENEELQGIVYIVDRNGTFEQHTYPSYDIMVGNMLYKHVQEPCLTLVLASPFVDHRFVFDEDFAEHLFSMAEYSDSVYADEMIEKAKILIAYQKFTKNCHM